MMQISPRPLTIIAAGSAVVLLVIAGILALSGSNGAQASGTVKISAGDAQHACAVTSAGDVRCWGANDTGQLGDGSMSQSSVPVNVVGLTSGAVDVSTGAFHSCAINASGGVECWGTNGAGELGDGSNSQSSNPVQVSGLASGVVQVSAGFSHACALTSLGGVKCWGAGGSGQLGNGALLNSSTPVDVIGLTTGVDSISAGRNHTCAVLSTTNTVVCWGANASGQLGNGTTITSSVPVPVFGLTSISVVAAGGFFSCAVDTSGNADCWGDNFYGQLGDGTNSSNSTPVSVSGVTTATTINAGLFHSCAVLAAGGIQCWGDNIGGQLGDGTFTVSNTPVNVSGVTAGDSVSGGGFFTCAVTTAGAAQCWGDNGEGQLGDGSISASNTPVNVLNLLLTDGDGDGCSVKQEAGPDEKSGGLRDDTNPYDYYDVAIAGGAQGQDGVIDLFNDISGVIARYSPAGLPPYDALYDRGPSAGPNQWNMTAPDGVIDLFNDIAGVIAQFGHTCA